MFKKIQNAGSSFAETTFADWAQKRMPKKIQNEDPNKAAAGIAAVSAGGILKSVGIVVTSLAVLALLSNPVTPLAALATMSVGLLGLGGAFFGRGMEKGGDKLSGILTFQKELRHGIAETARSEFRDWRAKKFSKSFTQTAKAAAEEFAIKKEQPVPASKPETGGP